MIIKQTNSIIEKAKKIDPTVKTTVEAEYVLKKYIAQNMGKNNTKDNLK